MKRPVLISFIIALGLMISVTFYIVHYQMPWDKSVRLPQGYCLGYVDTAPILLMGPASVGKDRLGPAVDGYRVLPRAIIGHVSPSGAGTSAGYFIVDMVTGRADQGLSREAWIDKLRQYEVIGSPELWRPSRRDEWLGRNKPLMPWNEGGAR